MFMGKNNYCKWHDMWFLKGTECPMCKSDEVDNDANFKQKEL